MSDKVELCRVVIQVYDKEQRIIIERHKGKENKTTYATYDGYSNRLIKKASTHKIDSNFIDNHKSYSYYTWCLFDELEHAIKSLKQHVLKRLETVKAEFEAVYAHKDIINNIVPVIKTDNE
jgi:hypothetical protein